MFVKISIDISSIIIPGNNTNANNNLLNKEVMSLRDSLDFQRASGSASVSTNKHVFSSGGIGGL